MKCLRLFAPLLALALAASGCGLFDTAQPEPPTGDIGIPPNFTLPEITLASLERAGETRSASNYALCLTDSLGLAEPGFYATPDPSDLVAWLQAGNPDPGIWTRERELTFFPQFIAYNPNAFYEVTFTQDPIRPDVSIDANNLILNRRYRVFAAGSPVAAGSAGLTISRVGLSGEWKVRFWEDLRDTADVRTWGTARLNGR
jgi:hypothetical protein